MDTHVNYYYAGVLCMCVCTQLTLPTTPAYRNHRRHIKQDMVPLCVYTGINPYQVKIDNNSIDRIQGT